MHRWRTRLRGGAPKVEAIQRATECIPADGVIDQIDTRSAGKHMYSLHEVFAAAVDNLIGAEAQAFLCF